MLGLILGIFTTSRFFLSLHESVGRPHIHDLHFQQVDEQQIMERNKMGTQKGRISGI